MELTAEVLAEMIDEAAAELDSWMPRESWVGRVDVAKLDMRNDTRCVAGQVFGGWCNTARSVTDKIGFGGYEFVRKYGRAGEWTAEANMRHLSAYETLTDAWREYLSS